MELVKVYVNEKEYKWPGNWQWEKAFAKVAQHNFNEPVFMNEDPKLKLRLVKAYCSKGLRLWLSSYQELQIVGLSTSSNGVDKEIISEVLSKWWLCIQYYFRFMDFICMTLTVVATYCIYVNFLVSGLPVLFFVVVVVVTDISFTLY